MALFRFPSEPPSRPLIRTPNLYLRAPQAGDYSAWAVLRMESRDFLTPWEPTWPEDSLGRDHYRRRLRQQIKEWRSGEAYSLFLFTNEGRRLAGGINLSNVRRGVAQTASVGYWMGQPFAGQGLMTDGLRATLPFVFDDLRLHRLDAEDELAQFGASSKLQTGRSFLLQLHDIGRRAAHDWLLAHGKDLGKRSSCALPEIYTG